MKTVTVRDLQKKVKECVDEAQEDRVVITRHGKPAAVLLGVEGQDWDTVVLQTDPAFWKLIHARRRQPTITLDQLKARLRKGGWLEASRMTGRLRGKKKPPHDRRAT